MVSTKRREYSTYILHLYLYVSFVSVDRAGELGFPALRHCEDHDLLEQEDGHLLQPEVRAAGGVVCAEQRPSQQQLALSHDLALPH